MEIHEVEVIIDTHGKVQVLVRGVKGPQCLQLTQGLEAALGGEVTSRDPTAESYEVPVSQTTPQNSIRTG